MIRYLAPLLLALQEQVPVTPPASKPAAKEDTFSAPAFPQFFPHPTGKNGYEEIIMAGDLIRRNALLNTAQSKTATLGDKRAALADTKVARALTLLRQGLKKPIHVVHTASDMEIAFKAYSGLRNLGRLLVTEQDVLFADGKTSEAVENLQDGLGIGVVVAESFLAGGMAGAVVQEKALVNLMQHMDELRPADWGHIVQLVRDTLNSANPYIASLETERSFEFRYVDTLRNDYPKFLQEQIELFDEEDDYASRKAENKRTKAELIRIKNNVAARETLATAIKQRIVTHFDAVIAALRNPTRHITILDERDKSLVGRLLNLSLSLSASATLRFNTIRTEIQLLGVHAAIRRYRYDHNTVPQSLSDLRLGDLEKDPFSGQPLVYQKTSDTTYDLSSIGTTDLDQHGKETGKRTPITLPPTPHKG